MTAINSRVSPLPQLLGLRFFLVRPAPHLRLDMDGQRETGRYTHAEAILGPELVGRLARTKVLLVGAGGIGCELRQSCSSPNCACSSSFPHAVKNIVLTGFGHITLLDLDTIDLSNLNRQFLFRKKDIKQSKAMVSPNARRSYRAQSISYARSQPRQPALSIPTCTFSRSTPTSRSPSSISSGSSRSTSSSTRSTISVSTPLASYTRYPISAPRHLTCDIRHAVRRPPSTHIQTRRAPTRQQDVHGRGYPARRVGHGRLPRSSATPTQGSSVSPSRPHAHTLPLGPHRVLRLHTEADSQVVPGVHHPINAVATDSLYRLGKELSPAVSTTRPQSSIPTHLASIGNCLGRTKMAGRN